MPRGDHRYTQHHHHARDGYDEDWDDDVYYAAASGPGSGAGSRAMGEEQRSNGANSVETSTGGRAGRSHAPTKRHYLKVPNLRQLRAMRPMMNNLSSDLHHRTDGQGSPRTGFANDQGETATSSSGDGSSPAPLGQLTPPAPPKREQDEQNDTSARESAVCVQGETVPSSLSAASPDGALPLGHEERESPRQQQFAVSTSQEQTGEAEAEAGTEATGSLPGNTCLVRLRGSPRSARDSKSAATRSPLTGSPGRSRGFPALGGRETAMSPLAVAASSGGGDGGGGAGGIGRGDLTSGSVSGAKRPRTPTGLGQRFGAMAWPKLRGEEPPHPKSSKRSPDERVTRLRQRNEKGGVESSRLSRLDGQQGGTMSASALSQRQMGAMRIRPEVGRLQQRQDDGERGRPPSIGSSNPGSSSASSASPNSIDSSSGTPPNASSHYKTRESHGNRPRSRGHGVVDMTARQGNERGGAAKGPSLSDRPARWGAKAGGLSVPPHLRSPGGKPSISSRGSCGNDTSNMLRKPPLSKAAPGRGFPGRAARGAWRAPGGDGDGEGRTFKLTSVFRATSNALSCARPDWSKDHAPPRHYRGHRAGSQYPPPNRGRNADSNSAATFDPTRMGTRARVQPEEVEEVGSEEEEDSFVGADNNVRVDCALLPGEGWGEEGRRGDSGDEVVRYDDQLLGGEGGAGEDGPSVERGRRGRQRDSIEAAAGGMDVSRGYARREDSGGFGSGDVLEEGRDVVSTTVDNEVLLAVNVCGWKDDIERPAPTRAGSPAVRIDPKEAVARSTTTAADRPDVECRQKKQQDTSKESSTPPPRTPIRPRTFSASTFSRGPPTSAATGSGGAGKWRPSFGGGGGADGSVVGRSPGAMHVPWAAFSTPLRRTGGVGEVPPSGSGLTPGSTSTRWRRGGGAGNGPLGRLLQQVRGRCDGDESRLLSGEFPFRLASTPTGSAVGKPSGDTVGRRDHGDPRTRCSLAVDVTVLPAKTAEQRGFQAREGGGHGEHRAGSGGFALFACFVHGVVDISSDTVNSRRREGGRASKTMSRRLSVLEGSSVDCLFKQETRRALDVCPGSQLRIYDPCCMSRASAEGGGCFCVRSCVSHILFACHHYRLQVPPHPLHRVAVAVACSRSATQTVVCYVIMPNLGGVFYRCFYGGGGAVVFSVFI